MNPELLRKIMAEVDAIYLETAVSFARGNTDSSEKRKKEILGDLLAERPGRARIEEMYRAVPDGEFEKVMSSLETTTRAAQEDFKEAVKYFPKNHGGRPSEFLVEIRRKAIQDVRLERARCDSLRDAIEVVAKHYDMTPDYLRKVWKNRKRLEAL
jgi:hypothetical protein